MNDKVKIRNPKKVIELNKNHKSKIDKRGDIIEKLNKQYEMQSKNNSSNSKINWIFIILLFFILYLIMK